MLCFHNSRRLDVDLPTHLETVGKLLVGSHLAGGDSGGDALLSEIFE